MNFGPQLMPDPIKALKGEFYIKTCREFANASYRLETHRILRKGGRTGFTCWTKPGWLPSIQEVAPSFTLPPVLSGLWSDPEAIKTELTALGFSGIETTVFDFRTNEDNVDNYLELMNLLLGKVFVHDTVVAYEKLMRGKHERGEMEMDWQALIVSAVKA